MNYYNTTGVQTNQSGYSGTTPMAYKIQNNGGETKTFVCFLLHEHEQHKLMMSLCFHVLFNIYIIALCLHSAHNLTQSHIAQSGTDCNQDVIIGILHYVTCYKCI